MKNNKDSNEFDVIIVGSGTCGATIARELSRNKKKVLILERGGDTPLRESFLGIASIASAVPVSNKLSTMRAVTTGGSTGLYFAVADPPPLETYRALGVDLSEEVREVYNELPVAPLSDDLMGPQALRLRESAEELGYSWRKKEMLVDQTKCESGYCYEAKWKAREYVSDAVRNGARIVNRATATRVIRDNNTAIGVEYKLRNRMGFGSPRKAYGARVVLAAGSLASPLILKNSGLKEAGSEGFYCNPNFAVMGTVPGLQGRDCFIGSMAAQLEEDIAIGDANLIRTFYRMVMLAEMHFSKLASYSSTITVGGSVKDPLGGGVNEKGRYYKELGAEVYKKLKKGEEAAIRILKNAGAKDMIHFDYASANVGGLMRINEHLDDKLQTEIRNLHVCDGSVIPGNFNVSPVLTLVSLAKYVSKNILSAL